MAEQSYSIKTSIRKRALALILPLVIISMLAIGLISFQILNNQTAKRSERYLQDRHNEVLTISEEQSVANYFHNISYGLSEEASLYKIEMENHFRRFSDRYNAIEQIYKGIRYIDKEGNEVAKFQDGKIGINYQNVKSELFFKEATKLPAWTVYTSSIEPQMVNATPIYWDEDGNGEFSNDELRGIIVVDFNYPLLQFKKERLLMAGASIGITILAILVTTITVSVLLRRVTRPLHQLVNATRAISSGDLSTEIPVQSDDEVGLLASSFNQMARDLKINIEKKDRYAAELATLNIELEDKVKARTRELERANQELQKANIKIVEADRLKSEFLANMSHELRTPMNAIIGFTRLVRRKAADVLPERQLDNLEKVEISAKQLLALINDILDLSKIEAGKMSLNVMSFEFAPLVDTCFSTVEPMVKKETVQLVKDVSEDLAELQSDPDKLKQIIINLLSNALKFTDKGEVKLSARLETDFLKIEVSDTGAGIPDDALDYIFDEFRQVDGSSTRRYGGTGLGLSITKKLTKMLGGTIEASSVEGKGSIFTVRIPFLGKDEELLPQEISEEDKEITSTKAGGKKILLAIDDDPNALILLKQNLEDENYYVIGALSADEGIQKAREINPYAITLDILMPKKDGWEVLNCLKADPATQDIPIIVISNIDNKGLGISLGAFDYIVKPFQKKAILSALNRIPVVGVKNVLVVDDEASAVDLLTQILQEEGYHVKGVFNGKEALDVLETKPQDIILLDLLMPEMDGFEVIQKIKAHHDWCNIPIIVVTAKDLTDKEWNLLNKSVDSIIQKSGLSDDHLMDEIQTLLRKHDAT